MGAHGIARSATLIALALASSASLALAEPGVLRVADLTSWPGYVAAMNASFGGVPDGASIRFDPADTFEADGSLPRPFDVQRIHFLVEAGEGTGLLDVFLHEDNGGHKPDETRQLFRTTVTAGPGENVVDLVALGTPVRIDPPRMFFVTFRRQGQAGAPRVAADDGLPYVGGTGDFHTSVNYTDPNCNVATWGFAPPDDPPGTTHSSNLMVWLDVDFIAPEPAPRFVRHPAMGGCSRCAWGDFDGDGDVDALNTGSQLFRNDGGGAFTDVTSLALPSGTRGLGGGLFGDFDRDGDLDWFGQTGDCYRCPTDNPVPQGRKNYDTIMRNVGDTNGDGVPELEDVRSVDFANADDAPVPGDFDPTEGAGLGDWNGDGWLDVYLANHNDWTTYEAFRDTLYVSDGPPTWGFTNASVPSGISSALLHGRGVSPADYDDDGDEDIFVSNYVLDPDLLWENRGVDEEDRPLFANVAIERGVAGTERLGAYGHGIGSAWGDVNRDGDLDLLVGNLAHSAWLCFSDTTKLYLSSGAAGGFTFTDVRPTSGIAYNEVHSDASFADIDNDADLDVVITHVYDGWRTSVYENLGGDPPTFRDVFHESGIGQRAAWGSAWADFDRDGDLDLWMGGGLYVNQLAPSPATSWLEVRLAATRSNPQSLGARVTVEAGGATQVAEVHGARGTSSQDDFVRHFGLGGASVADRVLVEWPSGCSAELTAVPANQLVDVAEPECLVPRFRVVNALDTPTGRPRRIGCIDVPLDFRDDSLGTPTSWQWDFDDDGAVDATTPTATWTFTTQGLHPVSLTVDDGQGPRTVRKPVRIDAPPLPPASGFATNADPCTSDTTLTWTPAFWGPGGPGVYNLYRGASEADALSRPPIVTGIPTESYTDTTTLPSVFYFYVVEAEEGTSPGPCDPGPHHGGSTSRMLLLAGRDPSEVPHLRDVSAADADRCAETGITVSWSPATWLDPSRSGTYHVYRAEGACPTPREGGVGDAPLVTGLRTTTYTDVTALPGVAYTYLVQAEDARTSSSCRPGPRNGGATTSACVTASVADLAEYGSADPGSALRAWRDLATGDVVLDWSSTLAVPLAGEAWAALTSDVVTGPWTMLPPGRLPTPSAVDSTAAGVPLRFYLATIVSPNDCPAE